MNPCDKHEAKDTFQNGAGFTCHLCKIEEQEEELLRLRKALEDIRGKIKRNILPIHTSSGSIACRIQNEAIAIDRLVAEVLQEED